MNWFEDIGKKIKGIAVVLFFIQIVFGFICAIATLVNYINLEMFVLGFFVSLFVLLITVAVAYLSVTMLYAMGELVDTNIQLRNDVYIIKKHLLNESNNTTDNSNTYNYRATQTHTPYTPMQSATSYATQTTYTQPNTYNTATQNKFSSATSANAPKFAFCPKCGSKQFVNKPSCDNCGYVFYTLKTPPKTAESVQPQQQPEEVVTTNNRKPIPIENNPDLIICPQCGKKQFSDKTDCSNCGCVFEK